VTNQSWKKFEKALEDRNLTFEKVSGANENEIRELLLEYGIETATDRVTIITEFKKRQNTSVLLSFNISSVNKLLKLTASFILMLSSVSFVEISL
jgi:hypothetical protein